MNAKTVINRDSVMNYTMTAKHTETTIEYKNAMTEKHTDTTIDYMNAKTIKHTDTTIDYKNAMTAKHIDIIIDYINAMTMAKTLQARSLLTKKEYIAFEEMTREVWPVKGKYLSSF